VTAAIFRHPRVFRVAVPAATAMVLACTPPPADTRAPSAPTNARAPSAVDTRAASIPAGVQQAAPPWPCTLDNPPTISSTVPNDPQFTDQKSMNCFAWQQFIALNWGALAGERGVPDPKLSAAEFGAPGGAAPTVWQTYKNDYEVMLPNGAAPPAWNAAPPAPPCSAHGAAARAMPAGARILTMTSKFDGFLSETAEASGQWLADQNGNPIWFELKMNQDEFDSIVANHFYDASVQFTTASTGKNPVVGAPNYQVVLPMGCPKGQCPNNGTPVTGAL